MTRPYVVTLSSEKGGVGKTTLATNLAIYLRALDHELPVTILSFDNHLTVDRMFGPRGAATDPTVADLFDGVPLQRLYRPGHYGIGYVPSCADPEALRARAAAPDSFARALLASELSGVLIIDTRPDLDGLTRNALYASDRVIVPVKDMPSLENCRHLFAFADATGIGRATFRLLPCLIDQRIRFDGPFRDPYELLRGFAINRGYPCYDLYIAKSPKVESLGTNPEGRVYPVFTQGRQTEVHQQFCQLTRLVYQDWQEGPQRLAALATSIAQQEAQERRERQARIARIGDCCLACGQRLEGRPQAGPLYYGETDDGRCGMMEEACLARLLFLPFRGQKVLPEGSASALDLLRSSAQQSAFGLYRRGTQDSACSLVRCAPDGRPLSQASLPLEEKGLRLFGGGGDFAYLRRETLTHPQDPQRPVLLLLQQVEANAPTALLASDRYAGFRQCLDALGRYLVAPA